MPQAPTNVRPAIAKSIDLWHEMIAKKVPGKEELYETLRYFRRQLELHRVTVNLASPRSLAWPTPRS